MKAYRCIDKDCMSYLPENQLLGFINSEGRLVNKCSRCRGNVKEVPELSGEAVEQFNSILRDLPSRVKNTSLTQTANFYKISMTTVNKLLQGRPCQVTPLTVLKIIGWTRR
jgi:hypothetical protein